MQLRSFLAAVFTILLLTLSVPAASAAPAGTVDDMLKGGQQEEEAPADEEPEAASVALSLADYLKMIFGLLFVLLLLYGVLKFLNSKNQVFQQNALMQSMGGIQLGNQKSVQLVKIGETIYIVGVGEDVSLMKEVTDEEEKSRLIALYNERQAGPASPYVSELIKKTRDRFSGGETPERFGDVFKTRLGELKKERDDRIAYWEQKEQEQMKEQDKHE